jgi:hypothetical protein
MGAAPISSARSERRKSPRIAAGEASQGHLKTTIPVTIVNLSVDGLLLELKAPLRPRMTYDLSAHFPGSAVNAMIRITRCHAGGYVEDGRGGRCLLFRAGAEFEGLAGPQREKVKRVVEKGLNGGDGSPGILQRG